MNPVATNEAKQDKEYMIWWNDHGQMNDPGIEYRAWLAGRSSVLYNVKSPFDVCTCSKDRLKCKVHGPKR